VTRWLRRPIVWLPISLSLFGLVAWRARPWEAGDRLGPLDPAPLLAAVLLNGAVMLLWAVRSADLLGAAGRPVGLRPLVPMTALANTVNNVTPGSVGELLRLYLLHERHGVDYPTGAAVVLIERVVAIGYLAGSAAVAWLAHLLGLPDLVAVVAFVAMVGLPALPYLVGIRPSAAVVALPLGPLLGRERWARTTSTIARIDGTVGALLTDPARLIVFSGTTALVLATYTAQLWLVGQATGVALDPVTAWGALGLSIAAGVVSFLPFGLGATDIVLMTLLATLGTSGATSAAIVFGYRLTATVPLALAGTASYAYLSATLPAGGASGAMRSASAALVEPPGESGR
jgi:uncharacterized protein (TIRG00374 family)